MDNSRIPKKVLDGKFYGRRPVGRPRLRWEDIRRDSLLLLNIRGWRRWTGDRDIWRRTVEPMWAVAPLKKKKSTVRFTASVFLKLTIAYKVLRKNIQFCENDKNVTYANSTL
jgi:hypothetical protein